MTTNRHQITNNPAQVIIYYDGNTSHLLELKDDIEQILSPLLPTQVKRVQGGASPAFPVLEIIFAFSVNTIMTSVLSKFGEDIYKHIKDKIVQKMKRIRCL